MFFLLTHQEPGPAKVAVTGSGIPEAEKVPDSSSIIWQEELSQREAEGASVWSVADLPALGSPLAPAGREGRRVVYSVFASTSPEIHLKMLNRCLVTAAASEEAQG